MRFASTPTRSEETNRVTMNGGRNEIARALETGTAEEQMNLEETVEREQAAAANSETETTQTTLDEYQTTGFQLSETALNRRKAYCERRNYDSL